MSNDKKRFILSLIVPIILLFVMYAVKIVEIGFNISLTYLGNYPISLKGLQGILLMPFIHGSWDHLLANTVPFFILCTALFYFYQKISFRVLIGIWILSGIWVWFGGRPSWHIGASGIIYGLSSFIFVSGLVRRDNRMAALALIVTFLYGSLVWGVFPDFYPREKNVSWEGHLGGAVAGLIMAIYYRNSGPKRKIYSWELEEEEDVETEDSYWKTTDTSI
jgi:membrane associated rhomboid family serine protease